MPDMRISQLEAISAITGDELFVAEQNGQTKNMKAEDFNTWLSGLYQANGYITSITGPVSSGNVDTYTIHFSGTTDTVSFDVTNGNGIASIEVVYGRSNTADPAYVTEWYSSVVAPTDALPYAFTRFTITDSTGGTTVAYTITQKADDPTITIGTVTAEAGSTADAAITNSGTPYNPVLNFGFTLPQGEKGDTGDYIVPVVSYGTSTAAATEPSIWYSSPTSISYTAGNYIWKKTEYTLHDAQTVQDTKKEIIGYIGQNGGGSGTVTQITFNGTVFSDDGTGNVTMNISPGDVDAIADPATKSNGQVLTYDSSADSWVAANPSTGNVNTVNSKGVDVGTTNITLYASDIKMSSSDNTTIPDAIPQASTTTPAPLGTADVGTGATWARADHVHNMPTPAQIGAVSTSDVQYNIYNSVDDIGLTFGSATISGVWNALPDYSIIFLGDGSFASGQLPYTRGMVEVHKWGTRGFVKFYSATTTDADYHMTFSSNAPSGTWVHDVTNNSLLVEQVTMPQMSLPASGTNHVNKDVSKSGYTPIAVSSITGSGTSGCNLVEFDLNGTTLIIYANNNTSSAKSPTYKPRILYLKT